ncbi:MAG TPA: potassium transporter TrkG [Candidatus Synoicihabitans sp.]|nr:potassium transporter TrkG [Candidatus Synoicihabitans sp.]
MGRDDGGGAPGRTPTFFGREIPVVRVRMAVGQLLFYSLTLGAGIYALALTDRTAVLTDQVFECISALGTVGLSRGLTGELTDAGKIVIIALMFLGRIGPLALGTALFRPSHEAPVPAEDVVI